jgi:hypothetical protein
VDPFAADVRPGLLGVHRQSELRLGERGVDVGEGQERIAGSGEVLGRDLRPDLLAQDRADRRRQVPLEQLRDAPVLLRVAPRVGDLAFHHVQVGTHDRLCDGAVVAFDGGLERGPRGPGQVLHVQFGPGLQDDVPARPRGRQIVLQPRVVGFGRRGDQERTHQPVEVDDLQPLADQLARPRLEGRFEVRHAERAAEQAHPLEDDEVLGVDDLQARRVQGPDADHVIELVGDDLEAARRAGLDGDGTPLAPPLSLGLQHAGGRPGEFRDRDAFQERRVDDVPDHVPQLAVDLLRETIMNKLCGISIGEAGLVGRLGLEVELHDGGDFLRQGRLDDLVGEHVADRPAAGGGAAAEFVEARDVAVPDAELRPPVLVAHRPDDGDAFRDGGGGVGRDAGVGIRVGDAAAEEFPDAVQDRHGRHLNLSVQRARPRRPT